MREAWEVWLAERAAPVRRQVAIELIKTGMDTALCLSHPGTLGIRVRAQDGSVVTDLSPVPRPNVGEISSAQFCGWSS